MDEERAKEAIKDGEAAWVQASSGTWDTSSWWRMGTALTLIRAQVLHQVGINVARGGKYNDAFSKRIASTKFASMEPVTRSNLLFLMEPENRIVLDRLLLSWKPDLRARRTHPITLAKYVKAELKPKPQPKPKPAAPAVKAAPSRQAEPEITLDMFSTKTAREQAEIFMRQQAKAIEAEIKLGVHAEKMKWEAAVLPEYKKHLAEVDRIIKARNGVMKKPLYNKVRMALHPDTYRNLSTQDRNELSQAWEELKRVLLNEADAPTRPADEMLNTPGWKKREAKLRAENEPAMAAYLKAKAKREAML